MIGRTAIVAISAVLFVLPAVVPGLTAVATPSAWGVFGEYRRLSGLLMTTVSLAALTVVFAAVPSAALALVVGHARKFGMSSGWLLAGMAIPPAVAAVAWHSTPFVRWAEFSSGWLAAGGLHALIGLPWVVLATAYGIRAIPSALEDDARLHAGWRGRLFLLDLRLARGYFSLGLVWVATQAATDIVITDLLRVRTIAEEVYTQAIAPAPWPGVPADLTLKRAVLVTLPVSAFFMLALMAVGRLAFSAESTTAELPRPGRIAMGHWPAAVPVVVPSVMLASRAFFASPPADPIVALSGNAALISASIIAALATGTAVSLAVGLAAMTVRPRWILAVTGVGVMTVPGPVIGLGVRQMIEWALTVDDVLGWDLLRSWLYDGPSMVPVMWAWASRCWPLAAVVWIPATLQTSTAVSDQVRLDTDSAIARFRHDLWPRLQKPFFLSAALVSVCCLGEVSASKLPATPGGDSFAHDVFTRMHYGITPDLAAMCVVLLGQIGLAAGLCLVVMRVSRPRPRPARFAPPLP